MLTGVDLHIPKSVQVWKKYFGKSGGEGFSILFIHFIQL